jgi:hypothetical protein
VTRREQLIKLCESDDYDVTKLAYLLIEENEKMRGALQRYAGRKVKFHEKGGGKIFFGEWDSVHSAGAPFFAGEIWEEGSFASEALQSLPLDELLEGDDEG